MFWTAVWFVVNLIFVVCAIAFLFLHRAYTMAVEQSEGAERIARLKQRRFILGVCSIVAFVAMAASFMTNMRLNG